MGITGRKATHRNQEHPLQRSLAVGKIWRLYYLRSGGHSRAEAKLRVKSYALNSVQMKPTAPGLAHNLMGGWATAGRSFRNLNVAVRSPSNSRFKAVMRNYLLVLVVDDNAFDWIRPIPSPPTAPASRPSSTSMGTLSISLLFVDLGILYPLL